MKIAIPTRGGQVDEHFGHCESYTVYSVADGQLADQVSVASPSGCGCKSNIATVLADMGVNVLLAGNMGQGAVNVLDQSGIKVVRGCSGEVEDLAKRFLAGEVKDQAILCDHHDCGHH